MSNDTEKVVLTSKGYPKEYVPAVEEDMSHIGLPNVMLAPNQQADLTTIKYPAFCSYKMDGIRAIFINGELRSRNMKFHPETIQQHFQNLCDFTRAANCVLDGEIYLHGLKFNEIKSTMHDTLKLAACPLEFHCFDIVSTDEWLGASVTPWHKRYATLELFRQAYTYEFGDDRFVQVDQTLHNKPETIQDLMELSLEEGFEGIMIRDPYSLYKHGRATIKENTFHKLKEFATVRAVITGFNYKEVLKADAPMGVDAMGYTERDHRKDSREVIDEIGSINLVLSDNTYFPVGTKLSATFAKNMEAYALRCAITTKNFNFYLGKEVYVTFQPCGSVDAPRFPRIVRLTGEV